MGAVAGKYRKPFAQFTVPTRYRVNADGTISTLEGFTGTVGRPRDREREGQLNARAQNEGYTYTSLADATGAQISNLKSTYEQRLADVTSRENTYNTLAEQIRGLTGGAEDRGAGALRAGPAFNEALAAMGADRNFGASDLSNAPDRGLISQLELREINSLLAEAKKLDPKLGTALGTFEYIPPAEQVPNEAIPFFISQGGSTRNPNYKPEEGEKWLEKKRNEMYDFASKYVAKEKIDALKTRFNDIYRLGALSSDANISSRLNFQVSDQQILDDYNKTRLGRLSQLVQQGNVQIIGITERLTTAQGLFDSLPSDDPRRTSSEVYINQLKNDLASVRSGVADATSQIQNYKPLGVDSKEGLREITSFREYLQLPEERASQQLRQIDPESYQTAVSLGQEYRKMATEPIGPTTTPETEALRRQLESQYRQLAAQPIGATTTPETEALRRRIEGEAAAQLELGSQLGAEEQRQYQQASRAAQTARGNIFGVAPAVEEAVTTGQAGEQRKLARYGAASQFLASGQTTGDALARDIALRQQLESARLNTALGFLGSGESTSAAMARDLALREGLRQQRLGAAAGFIAGGPSIYNLAQARTQQQQGAFQNYVAANLPGATGFAQAPSTAQPFFQIADQGIPVNLQNAFANLYGSQAQYQASTYGAQVGAIAQSYRSPGQEFAAFAGGGADILGKVAPFGLICWVAREVYGEDNPKWMQFREWLLTKASENLRKFYIKHGEKIAKSISNKPKIKAIIRKWMDSKIIELGGV